MAQIELNNLSLLLEHIGVDVVGRFKKAMETPIRHRNGSMYDTVASGRTRDSASSKFEISDTTAKLVFNVDDRYLRIRDGHPRGQYANWSGLRQWMIDRNLKTGDTKQDRRSLANINRSIKEYGIVPKPFLDLVTVGETINSALNSELSALALDLAEYRDDIVSAVGQDIIIYLKQIANGNI